MIRTEKQRMVRDLACSFASAQLAPNTASAGREHRFRAEALRTVGAQGRLGMPVPTQWDGAGTDHFGYALELEEIAAGDGATATIVGVHAARIAFEDCEVAADQMLGAPGEGYHIALTDLEGGGIGIAAQSVGMAPAAREVASHYAQERTSFGVPPQDHQAVALRWADMATQIEAAHQLVLHAASPRDAAGHSCARPRWPSSLLPKWLRAGARTRSRSTAGTATAKIFRWSASAATCACAGFMKAHADIQRLVVTRQLESQE